MCGIHAFSVFAALIYAKYCECSREVLSVYSRRDTNLLAIWNVGTLPSGRCVHAHKHSTLLLALIYSISSGIGPVVLAYMLRIESTPAFSKHESASANTGASKQASE